MRLDRVFEEDRQLARRLVEGDQRSFQVFYDTYAPKLGAFVVRRTGADYAAAEDIVQSTLIRAVRALPQYRGEASLFTWLCQICRSEIADQYRKAKRRPSTVSIDENASTSTAVEQMQAAVPMGSEAYLAADGADAAVMETLNRLPNRYAQALEWKYGDDRSVEEISRILGTTVTGAQSLLARARDAFRTAWRTGRATDGAKVRLEHGDD
jgi:RNA polymerase sigma-70 factor (ECF subfamily)